MVGSQGPWPVSFDSKGVYAFDEKLGERVTPRGISCMRAFYLGRMTTIVVNRQTSERWELPHVGLPRGSPVSLLLFLFFNADLWEKHQHKIWLVDGYST